MKKLWLLAKNNIKKTKSASFILGIMFLIAAFLLNIGLLIIFNYGNQFNDLKEELKPTNAYFTINQDLYQEEVKTFFEEDSRIKSSEVEEGIVLETDINYQGSDKSYEVLFLNMDHPRTNSQWKYVGEHLANNENSVYLPDVFRAIGNYELNDIIQLKYTDILTDSSKSLDFKVKGYTEDFYFSSSNMKQISFYLPSELYNQVKETLGESATPVQLIFANVDDIKNISKIEMDLKKIANVEGELMFSSSISIDVSDIEIAESSRSMMANMISAMLVVFAIVIVFVCLLVVRFRIINNIEDDVVKIGSLKSVGYTNRQIVLFIVMQFLSIAIISAASGIILSYFLLPSISLIFEQQSGINWIQNFDAIISPGTLIFILGIVILITLFTARRIIKLNPIDALRGEIRQNKFKKNRISLEKAKSSLSLTLSLKSVIQNIKLNIMIAIIIIATVFAGLFGVIMFYNTSVDTTAFEKISGMEIRSAIAFLNPAKDQTQNLETIEKMNEVEKISYYDQVTIEIENQQARTFLMEDYSKKETNVIYEGHYPEKDGEIAIAGIVAERINKKIGDIVTIKLGEKSIELKVVGLTEGVENGFNTSMRTQDYLKLSPDFKKHLLNIYLKEGTDTSAFIDHLKKEISKEDMSEVVNVDKSLEEGLASYQGIVNLMGIAMLGITMFVVVLVLYFMIGTTIVRSKRELGIKKAIGFTTGQLMNQIAITFVLPIILGVAIGGVLGAFGTNPLMTSMMKGMGIMKASFIVNPIWIIIFSVLVILLSYFLALLITFRIRKISAYELVTE